MNKWVFSSTIDYQPNNTHSQVISISPQPNTTTQNNTIIIDILYEKKQIYHPNPRKILKS